MNNLELNLNDGEVSLNLQIGDDSVTNTDMKALPALQADRKSLMAKLLKLDAEKLSIAEEIEKIDHAISALGGKVILAKPVVKRKTTKLGKLKIKLGQAKRRGQADKVAELTAEIEKLDKK